MVGRDGLLEMIEALRRASPHCQGWSSVPFLKVFRWTKILISYFSSDLQS